MASGEGCVAGGDVRKVGGSSETMLEKPVEMEVRAPKG